jgi:hypothetical protein
MEAASRPPLELLPDLPVDEPLDVAAVPGAASSAAPPNAAAPAPAHPVAGGKDPEQPGLNFVDPELYLADGQKPSAVPVVDATSVPLKAADPAQELELEDPVVDDLLTSPPPPRAAAAHSSATAASAPIERTPTAISSAPSEASMRTTARVPIARTASLAAAASKIAAASAARGRSAPKVASAPQPFTTPMPSSSASPAGASKPPAASPATPKVEAPSLASWANARAAAAAPKVNAGPPVPNIVAPPSTGAATKAATPVPLARPVTSTRVGPVPTPAVAPAQAAAVPAAPPMDRDFIARNQVVERYLSGRLPLKGATDFEHFCHDHPELLDEIGLPERVNAGVRLLEASGKPEPWQEAARPAWQRPQVTLALAAAVAILAVALAVVASGSVNKSHHIADLQKQSHERALDPATSRREIRLLPSRSGASNSPAITIGGAAGSAQLADLKIDESRSPYHAFRVTIDRIDQGRVAVISNLGKDSNGHLRIALNSSALGPGNYQLTLEGLDWRGEPQPDSWVTIGIQH